jgi:DNA-binding NarL/FixJ family response regulator
VREALEQTRVFEIVGEADEAACAVKVAYALQPDLILLDLAMQPDAAGYAMAGFRVKAPTAQIVALAAYGEETAAPGLSGAIGVVRKGLSADEFFDQLRSLLSRAMTDWAQAPSSDSLTTVLLVDDVRATRRFLREVLEATGRFAIVGEADTPQRGVKLADALKPDVILLDLSMPGGNGGDAVPPILVAAPNARVVVLSGHGEDAAATALRAGAIAFIPKGMPPDELVDRLSAILDRPGRASVGPHLGQPKGDQRLEQS